MRHIPTYRSWEMMKQRCNNPTNASYEHYGERGITYDPAWESYKTFLADMGEKPEGLTLDRKDVNKGYSKENCRWATHAEQRANRRPERVHTNKRIDSKSGLLGVSFHSRDKKWQAYFYENGRQFHIYRGLDFFEACCARKSYESGGRWTSGSTGGGVL